MQTDLDTDEYDMTDEFVEELMSITCNLQASGVTNREILSLLRQHPKFNFALQGQKPGIKVRDRECQTCKWGWTSEVKMSPYTTNLSGEATEHCPMCNSKNVISWPIKELPNA
jgi:hypothetical protein